MVVQQADLALDVDLILQRITGMMEEEQQIPHHHILTAAAKVAEELEDIIQ
jgi:hypothetical protein